MLGSRYPKEAPHQAQTRSIYVGEYGTLLTPRLRVPTDCLEDAEHATTTITHHRNKPWKCARNDLQLVLETLETRIWQRSSWPREGCPAWPAPHGPARPPSHSRPLASARLSSLEDGLFSVMFVGLCPAPPQLPFKRPQIPANRDHKALSRGTSGGLGL